MKTLRRILTALPLVAIIGCGFPTPTPEPITPNTNHSPTANLVIDSLSGEAPLTTNISLTGTDEDGDIITYHLEIDDNSDEIIDYSKTQFNPIQTERTFSAGKATIYGRCSDPYGLKSELEQEVMISEPTPDNQLPTSTFSVSPTSGQYPLTAEISLDGEDSDGHITEYKLEIDKDGDGEIDETFVKSSPIYNELRTFEPGNVMIYGTVTDDKGGEVIKGQGINVSEREDLKGEIIFEESYHVHDFLSFIGKIQNATTSKIIANNSLGDRLEYRLVKEGEIMLTKTFSEGGEITLLSPLGYLELDYKPNIMKFTLENVILNGVDLSLLGKVSKSFPNLDPYEFTEAGLYSLEIFVKYSLDGTEYHKKFTSDPFNVFL